MVEAVVTVIMGFSASDLRYLFAECDHPRGSSNKSLPAKGFWRIDKDRDPELRHTVLALVAVHDLEAKIRAADGSKEQGIKAFLDQNDGEGWLLPETLRLADYGLGYDERAKHPQPVASRLGPRFYDWQLVQSAEESWRECHLHARNLHGARGYASLIVDLIERRISSDEDHDLFADGYTRSLLGEEGYVIALVDIRVRGVLDESAYWTMVDDLWASSALNEGLYCRVLDSLRAHNLIDELDYRRRRPARRFHD